MNPLELPAFVNETRLDVWIRPPLTFFCKMLLRVDVFISPQLNEDNLMLWLLSLEAGP